MSVDEKMLMDLAGRMGMGKHGNEAKSMIEDISKNYAGKSDDQLVMEIMKLKEVIKKDPKAYNQQLQTIKALKPMMTPEQRKKLESLLKMLE